MTTYPYFSAKRHPHTHRWVGWVQFEQAGPLTFTPDDFATRDDAVAAIKERV